jgi:hypothetical protein
MKELAEFRRAFPFRRVGENSNQPAREVPEFFIFAPHRIAEAFEFVRAAFVRMEVRSFNMNPQKVWMKFARRMLIAERLERG